MRFAKLRDKEARNKRIVLGLVILSANALKSEL
jgi:hypothetical protein